MIHLWSKEAEQAVVVHRPQVPSGAQHRHPTAADASPARVGAAQARARGRGDRSTRLHDALAILGARLREAVAQRRSAQPGTEAYRRADELVAYVNELYLQLQHRMEIPGEVWLLAERDPLRAATRSPGRRTRR